MARLVSIKVKSQNCTGCQLCMLVCSFVKTSSFSLSQSRIVITRLMARECYEVSFTPECDLCSLCINYCCFDALERGDRVKADPELPESFGGGLEGGD